MRYFIAIPAEHGYIKNGTEVFAWVVTDICTRTIRLNKWISLLPDSDGMCFYAGKVLKIFNGKMIHTLYYKQTVKKFN